MHAEEPKSVAEWEVKFTILNNVAPGDMESKASVKVLSDAEVESSRDFMKAVRTSYKTPKNGLLGKLDTDLAPKIFMAEFISRLCDELDKALVKLAHIGALLGKPV